MYKFGVFLDYIGGPGIFVSAFLLYATRNEPETIWPDVALGVSIATLLALFFGWALKKAAVAEPPKKT